MLSRSCQNFLSFPLSTHQIFQPQLYYQLQKSFIRPYKNPFKKRIQEINRWRIVKGDIVQVNSGKDKGKIGTVLHMERKFNKVYVEGVNYKLKRVKADEDGEGKSGINTIQHPIHYSNVNLVDPETGEGTKTRFGFLADGTKVRISRTSGQIIPKPDRSDASYSSRNEHKIDGKYDTSVDKVLEVTYKGEDFLKVKNEFDEYIRRKEELEHLLVFSR